MNIKLSKGAKKAISMAGYTPRQKLDNEARPSEDDLFQRPVYRTGDGEPHPYVPRPGSMVAYSLPSRGIGA